MDQPAPGVEESWIRKALLTLGGFYSRESRLIRGANGLYTDIVEQATNKDFYTGDIRLPPCIWFGHADSASCELTR